MILAPRTSRVTLENWRNMLGTLAAAVETAVWILPPGQLKNMLLRRFGHSIGRRVSIGPILVLRCTRFAVGDGVNIGACNVFRALRKVDIDREARIGAWNWFSAHPSFQMDHPTAGTLSLGRGSFVTSRHYFDCSGEIVVGAGSAVAGQRSTLQTHELDLASNEQSIGRIVIGDRSFISTGCILLRDSALPARSLLAAGSTLTRHSVATVNAGDEGLWIGTPAKFVRPLSGKWFDRILDE